MDTNTTTFLWISCLQLLRQNVEGTHDIKGSQK